MVKLVRNNGKLEVVLVCEEKLGVIRVRKEPSKFAYRRVYEATVAGGTKQTKIFTKLKDAKKWIEKNSRR